MRPAKRERRSRFVIEPCSQPPACGVAACAVRALAFAPELASVYVLVTSRALARDLEWDLSRASLRIDWPVAILASEGQVGAG
jgi:hypothetical protein